MFSRVDAVLLDELIKAVRVAGLEEHQHPALLAGFLDQIFGKVAAAEVVVHEFRVQLLRRFKRGRGHVVDKFARLPAENALDRLRSARSALARAMHHFLHLRSSSLLFSPSAVTAATNSFMVAANFAPSAAETHSTRVRSFSMPR